MSHANQHIACRSELILILILALFALPTSVLGREVAFSGQASGAVTLKDGETDIGARYIPELSLLKQLPDGYEFNAEAAANARWSSRFHGSDQLENTLKIDPYRLWMRFASPQYEVRAGLQKINFGSATLLRPLMWFDSVDPRDPLQLTDGVYGLLGRYYFKNNANVWGWALYGNDSLKGWETSPSDKRSIEFGGRAQLPVASGEMGLSFHQRRAEPKNGSVGGYSPVQGKFQEQRFGLDGKWDLGVGLWFEGTLTHREINPSERSYQRLLTLGMDYTFDIGNGPHLLFEQFVQDEAQQVFSSGKGSWISALSVDYPINILDTITVIVYYDWNRSEWSRLLQLQRTYDRWQIIASGFWNPKQTSPTSAQTSGSFAGSGALLTLVFNH